MPRVAADVPSLDSILCAGCGYTLDGLSPDSNCPECGKPISQSTTGDGRLPPAWESSRSKAGKLIGTTLAVIFRPTRFFKSLPARDPLTPAYHFALGHWVLASMLFGDAVGTHWHWYATTVGRASFNLATGSNSSPFLPWYVRVLLVVLIFAALWLTTLIAAALSAWEARYRGMRLPKHTVLRALYYHAAHYLPVGILAVATTRRHAFLLESGRIGDRSDYNYLIILSVEIILAAAYLFWTYWIGMRNMLYANR